MGALLSATYAKLRSECQLLGVSERFAAIEFPLIAKVPKLGVSQGVFLAKLIEKLLFNSCLSEIGGSLLRYQELQRKLVVFVDPDSPNAAAALLIV